MMNRRAFRCLLVAVAIAVAAALSSSAQTTSSSLLGTVRLADGNPASGAVVQAISRAQGMVRSVVTDHRGAYRLDLLPPGEWTVAARGNDGGVSESRTVMLGLQQTVRLDLTLGEGLTEQVEVLAEAPLVDANVTGGELRILGEQTDGLPVSGRVITDLALLDASVRPTPPGNFYGERGSVFVINGQSGRANSFLVDGLDNNDQTSGTTLNAFFSQQVVREFVVLTHQYSPEFGRAAGGVVNVITERGRNDRRTEVFAQSSFSDLNEPGVLVSSLPRPAGVQDSLGRFQSGFRMGGPFKKDRAFYFLAYEHQRSDEVVPYTGVDRNGLAGGWTVAPNRGDNLFFRTDFNLNSANLLMVRLSADDRQTRRLNVGGVMTPEAGFSVEERDLQLAASWTTIASADVMNELRLLVGSSEFDQFANSDRPGVSRPSGVFGGNNLNRQLRAEDRIQLVDNVTWQIGAHTLKFGLDLTRSRTLIDARFNPDGNFLYDTDRRFEPGDGFVFPDQDCVQAVGDNQPECPGIPGVDDDGDGLIDERGDRDTYPVVFALIDGQPLATLEDTRIAAFAQDRWQIGPKLMLDYGLRYDLSTFRLPPTARVESSIPNGGAGRDTDNIAPRFGFTFRPTAGDELVIRGGAGVFYDKLVLAFPGVAAVTSGTRIGLIFPAGFGVEVTEDLVEQIGIDPLRGLIQFPEAFVLKFSTGTELDTPYAVQFNLGLEAKAGRRGAWKANVVRALGYHVPLMRDLNPVQCFLNRDSDDSASDPCANPDTADDLVDPKRIPAHRDKTTGSIAAVVTEGRSWYTALDLGWRWRSNKTWFSASYTLSRSEDLGPDPLKGGIYLPPNSDDLLLEKGRADHDRRHRLVLAGEWGLFGGLRASGVFQLASGAAFNVTTGQDDNRDGIGTDRPAGIGRNTGEDTPLAPVNDLRTDVGLPPVTSLKEPSLAQIDLRVWKSFSYGQDGAGQVFVQVFNLANRFNGGPIEGRVTSRNFGQAIGQVTLPRTVEFGLKFAF